MGWEEEEGPYHIPKCGMKLTAIWHWGMGRQTDQQIRKKGLRMKDPYKYRNLQYCRNSTVDASGKYGLFKMILEQMYIKIFKKKWNWTPTSHSTKSIPTVLKT